MRPSLPRRHPAVAALAVCLFCASLLLPNAASAEDLAAHLEERISAAVAGPAARASSPLLTIQSFYADRQFAPVWIAADGATPAARALAEVIGGGAADGLHPEDYGHAAIAGRLDVTGPAELAELDFLLSRAVVEYGSDLESGRVHPGEADAELHIEPEPVSPLQLLAEAAAAADIAAYLAGRAPKTPEYARLKAALARYREIAQAGGWSSVPAGETLKPGMRDARVPALRRRLREAGELPETAAEEPALYDAALEAAVKRFQRRHGLDQDGVVGKATLGALNVPAGARVAQIELNMERRRWMPDDLGERYVFVNLADFVLKVVDGPRTIHDARVVVGKPYHRTPVFSAKMTYMVLNPQWHVPPSIAVNEILPKLRRDPGYLASQNIRLLSGWGPDAHEIDPRSVDWSRVGPRSFPYKLRQDSGDDNALGKIKFMFPNRFNVYIHDTPSKSLFQRAVRSFSHGCVRVQNPFDLAEMLLRDDPDWSREKLDARVADRQQQVVTLKRPIPVHVTYLTAWVNKDGSVHFRDDVYGRDARLAAALAASRGPGRRGGQRL